MAFDFRLPESLRSTDFKTFEAIYKIVLSVAKRDIDNITLINDPAQCPPRVVELLAGKVGAEYYGFTSQLINREIIKNWWIAIRNKGTYFAMQLMASLALMTFNVDGGQESIIYNRSVDIALETLPDGTQRRFIRISYQPVDNATIEEQEERMMDFMEYVRPAGFGAQFVRSEFSRVNINMEFQHQIEGEAHPYSKNRFSAIADRDVIYKLPEDPTCFGSYADGKKPECAKCEAKDRCSQWQETGVEFTETADKVDRE